MYPLSVLFEVVNQIAESISGEGKAWEVTIKTGIKFSDGTANPRKPEVSAKNNLAQHGKVIRMTYFDYELTYIFLLRGMWGPSMSPPWALLRRLPSQPTTEKHERRWDKRVCTSPFGNDSAEKYIVILN